ncbi:MAG: hypothetical protein ABW006_09030, partial [Hyphomicrobium sp.]
MTTPIEWLGLNSRTLQLFAKRGSAFLWSTAPKGWGGGDRRGSTDTMTASRGDSIPGSRKLPKTIPATAMAVIALAICVFPGPHADAKQKKHHNPETNMAQPNAAAPAAATPEPGKTPSTS